MATSRRARIEIVVLWWLCLLLVSCRERPQRAVYERPEAFVLAIDGSRKNLLEQTADGVGELDRNCVSCHEDVRDPHRGPSFNLACIDCHGGNPAGTTKDEAHPRPRLAEMWPSSANPRGPTTFVNEERWSWIRFVNPGDLRVAHVTCGPCHGEITLSVAKSLMATSAHFWGTAGYCNGIVSAKQTIFGEAYGPDGTPLRVNTVWTSAAERERDLANGVVASIVPLPHWEITQPGNVFRVFEKGSRLGGVALGLNGSPTPLVGLPEKLEDPGRPNNRLSDRGLGTLNRVDLPLLNVHKTRLNDPFLYFFGTNDHPGDYRSSGCTACHVVYANDRTPTHSGPYAVYGNTGRSFSTDPTIPKDESGHPIEHAFTTAIPSSQCMVCHHHQPNAFLNTYFGFQMWTYEADGEAMWPAEERRPTNEELVRTLIRNPEEAATRGLWGDPEFLRDVSDLNPRLRHTQFSDYHGHGWVFRAVFKMDRKGNLLDADGNVVPHDAPDKFEGVIPRVPERGRDEGPVDRHFDAASGTAGRAVHLKDIHAERGMHCVDCHFEQDVHGNQKLYAEYQGAIEIACADCHGTVTKRADLVASGPAASAHPPRPFTRLETPFGKPRFEVDGGEIWQNSMVQDGLRWRVPQVRDSVDEESEHYNPRSARAKKTARGGSVIEGVPEDESILAHNAEKMTCYACHTSWVTSCFGCHLPQKANMRTPMRHFEEKRLRNFASYNPQVARDDAFMLGIAPDVQENRISTVRSSSAILISSEDAQRQRIYTQIPTIAANGMSSQAFNTHFAHTVRTRETRQCEDCHVSERDDNNAWLAQVFLLGTNFVNFVGYNCYVGCESDGFHAVRVTEWDEPQAVIGSNLHRLAYPERYARHLERERVLSEAEHHTGSSLGSLWLKKTSVLSLELRGEYVYAACGPDGLHVFDVANIGNKGFSEKIVTAPVSPLGQDTHVPTRFATAVALPTNNHISMSRVYRPENRERPYEYRGRAQNMHESYRYAYVSDLEEGLVIVDVDCLTDGDPENNFVRRVLAFNPDGALDGAVNLAVAGTTVYVCAAGGISAVDIDDPLEPRIIAHAGAPSIRNPRSIAVQFRYAFVCDDDGVKVLDVTVPERMAPVAGAVVPIPDARDVYVARTYAYVAAGEQGLVILDVERPREPRVDQVFDAGGAIDDLNQVKVGMTNDSVFAYLADGWNGLRVVQLVSPADAERTGRSAYGFSSRPAPEVVATYPTSGPALAIAKGLDRDRAVDESGNQMAVFGRIGGRPLDLEERQRLYLKGGAVFTVSNEPQAR